MVVPHPPVVQRSRCSRHVCRAWLLATLLAAVPMAAFAQTAGTPTGAPAFVTPDAATAPVPSAQPPADDTDAGSADDQNGNGEPRYRGIRPFGQTVAEWVNRTLPVAGGADVYASPEGGGSPVSRLAPGAQVLVLGRMSDPAWLKIKLPDDSIGYIASSAVPEAAAGQAAAPQAAAAPSMPSAPPAAQTTDKAVAAPVPSKGDVPSAPPAAQAPTFATPAIPAAPPTPAPAQPAQTQPFAPPPPAAAAQPAPATPDTSASAGPAMPPTADAITGRPIIRDTATLVIEGRAILLSGIEGVGGAPLNAFRDLVEESGGSVTCVAEGAEGTYICRLADGTDLAMAALINGAARVGPGAPAAYREQEDVARANHRGIWADYQMPVGAEVVDVPLPDVQTVAVAVVDGLAFVDAQPYTLYGGMVVPVVYEDGVWGYWDAGHLWHIAPSGWSIRLDRAHPHGEGLTHHGFGHRDVAHGGGFGGFGGAGEHREGDHLADRREGEHGGFGDRGSDRGGIGERHEGERHEGERHEGERHEGERAGVGERHEPSFHESGVGGHPEMAGRTGGLPALGREGMGHEGGGMPGLGHMGLPGGERGGAPGGFFGHLAGGSGLPGLAHLGGGMPGLGRMAAPAGHVSAGLPHHK